MNNHLERIVPDMAQRKKQPQKVVKYRKPLNLNIGMLIFVCIFIIIVRCIVSYFGTERVVGYEVKEGSLYTDNIYRGIVLRSEEVINSNAAGYVNYYAREGEKVGNNKLVYMLDETGEMKEYFNSLNLGENSLDNDDLRELKIDISNFEHNFDENSFASTYDFKRLLSSSVMKLANQALMNEMDSVGSRFSGAVSFVNASESGVVTYWVDGYETLRPEDVTEDIFKEEEYSKQNFENNRLITAGEPVYKISTDEKWSIIVPIDAARGAEIEAEEYVKVRFLKNLYESWGQAKLLNNPDGNTYLQLSFTNSMIAFVKDRFLDIEIILETETGLKIPNSSIVEKEFFLVPEEYITKGGNKSKTGVLRQIYLEDGSTSTEFVETDIYSNKEGECYLDNTTLGIGNVLIKTESTETYTVSKVGTLIGVYNINKGYADFKEIHILYQNEEYAIVKANNQYSLNVYDYIALDAEAVTDNEFIYE